MSSITLCVLYNPEYITFSRSEGHKKYYSTLASLLFQHLMLSTIEYTTSLLIY